MTEEHKIVDEVLYYYDGHSNWVRRIHFCSVCLELLMPIFGKPEVQHMHEWEAEREED